MSYNGTWYCPAVEQEITDGLCWEYCFAERGGPTDAAGELVKWINKTKKYNSIEEFHKACEDCSYCQALIIIP